MPEIYRNGKNYGAAMPNGGATGQALIKNSNADGDVTWGDANGAVFSYVVGATPYASDWLSLTATGSAFTPNAKLLYLIVSSGEYYHNFVRWDSANSVYVPVAAGGAGGGAIFSYIDPTKTALDDDWLLDGEGSPISPEDGLLYLVLSTGEYYNSIYRFDETTSKYVLVQSADGGVIFATVDSTKTALNPDWLENSSGSTITPKVGLLYLVLSDGEYKNSLYRFDTSSNKYALVQRNVQIDAMPVATSANVGIVVQYTGVTTSEYTHNFFYECVNDSGSYKWVEQKVTADEVIELYANEFEALTDAERNNGKVYFIKDAQLSDYYMVKSGFTPIGTIITVTGESAPSNYLLCDGSVHDISRYPLLADFFEAQYGSSNVFGGDGVDTFAVPDLQSGSGSSPLLTLLPSNVSLLFCIAYTDIYVEPFEKYSYIERYIGVWEDNSPKYQITITGTTPNSTSGEIDTGLTGIAYAEIERFQVTDGTYIKNLLDSVAIKSDGTEISMSVASDSSFKDQTFYATINYKKLVPLV